MLNEHSLNFQLLLLLITYNQCLQSHNSLIVGFVLFKNFIPEQLKVLAITKKVKKIDIGLHNELLPII